jgi:hypothetical protein
VGINLGKIRIGGTVGRLLTGKGTEQVLGSAWGWLADIRDPIDRRDAGVLATVFHDSPLSPAELRAIAAGATAAANAKEAK